MEARTAYKKWWTPFDDILQVLQQITDEGLCIHQKTRWEKWGTNCHSSMERYVDRICFIGKGDGINAWFSLVVVQVSKWRFFFLQEDLLNCVILLSLQREKKLCLERLKLHKVKEIWHEWDETAVPFYERASFRVGNHCCCHCQWCSGSLSKMQQRHALYTCKHDTISSVLCIMQYHDQCHVCR